MKRLAMGVAVLGACVALADIPVELKNAGFERVGKDGWVTDWSKAKGWSADRCGHNGSGGLVFERKAGEKESRARPSQRIAFKTGKRYYFSALVKASGLKPERVSPVKGIGLYMEGYDAKGKWLFGRPSKPCANGNRDWIKTEGLTTEVPDNCVRVEIQPIVNGVLEGKGYIDNIYVAEYEVKPVEGVYCDRYRREAADGIVHVFAALNTEKNTQLEKYTATFTYTDATGAKKSVPGTVTGLDAATAAIDVAALAKGTHDIVCTLAYDGKELGSGALSFTRLEAPARRRVHVSDANGLTYVDGKPFFPLGMYCSKVTPEMLDVYTQAPVNVMCSYANNGKEQLDLIHARGLKIIFNLQGGFRDKDDGEKYMRDRISAFKDHPALLAWYTNDEHPLTDVPKLERRQKIVEKYDTEHPTWCAQDVFGEIRHYLGTYDVLGMDPYPVNRKPIGTVISSLRQARTGTFGTRAVWQIPQAFGWNWLRRRETRNQLAPNKAETANMTWQSIAGGANGLVYYAFHHLALEQHATTNNADELTWPMMCDILRDVKKYESVFLSEERPPVVNGGTLETAARAWSYQGADYVLAVNCTTNAQAATFIVGGAAKRRIEARDFAGSETRAELDGNRLSVALPPIGYTMLRLTPVK